MHSLDLVEDLLEKILEGSVDLIQLPSVKIQIIGRKVCLKVEAKQKVCLHHPAMFCPITSTFPPVVSIFTEGDGIESRLSSQIFSTLAEVT